MNKSNQWKKQTILISTLLGTLIGFLASYVWIQQAEENNATPSISAGEGVKVGMGVLNVLRTIADIGAQKRG